MGIKYERTVKPQLLAELANEKIIIVTGPRQSGKTTLLEALAEDLRTKKEQVFYYNFDRFADLDFFKSQQKVEAFLRIRSMKQRLYIFIDEVQRKPQAGTFFKFFYDAGLNVKFIFSGSSSIELTDSFGDALTGRKRLFTLLPLSISEIATAELSEEWGFSQQGDPVALAKLQEIISDKLVWGSYPEVVSKSTSTGRLRALGELYESYIQKDVKDLLRVKNISGFNLLVKLLAFNVGKSIVVEDFVRQADLHANTVNSYLDILTGTMIMGFTENYNPEFGVGLPKSRHYYFFDNGMRNYALGQMQSDFRPDLNQLASNLVFTELSKVLDRAWQIAHYQTYSENQIEFILQPKDSNKFSAVTIRYSDETAPLGKGIHEYLANNQPQRLLIITSTVASEEIIKNIPVRMLPLAEFLAQPLNYLVS